MQEGEDRSKNSRCRFGHQRRRGANQPPLISSWPGFKSLRASAKSLGHIKITGLVNRHPMYAPNLAGTIPLSAPHRQQLPVQVVLKNPVFLSVDNAYILVGGDN